MNAPHHHRPETRIAGMLPLRAAGHLRELRLQIRKAGGCLATIESASATRAERDAARVAFHRHAEAIAHTMVMLDSAPLLGCRGEPTTLAVLADVIDEAAALQVDETVAAVRHG